MEDIRAASKNQLIRGGDNRKTICEVFRLIYDEVHEMPDNEKITELLVDGIIMGYKMHTRLKYYFKKYGDKTGGKGIKLEKMTGSYNRRRRRQARVI